MKILIDPETNDQDGNPIPVAILENIKFFGLAAMVDDVFVFRSEGDPLAVACAIRGLEICVRRDIERTNQKMK